MNKYLNAYEIVLLYIERMFKMDITTITRNEKIDAIADAFCKCNQPERGNLFISSSDLLSDDDVDYYYLLTQLALRFLE